jgi:hypothetical protein
VKIRIVHILNNIDTDREINSIKSISNLNQYGVEYIQYITPRYNNDAWRLQTPISNWKRHGSGHFGAFLSFKNATLNYFTDDLDAFIITESDCILSEHITYDFFIKELYNAIEFSKKYKLFMFSFGSRYFNNILQSPILELDAEYPNFCKTNNIILNHCILFTKPIRNLLLHEYIHSNWDSPDIWHNCIFNKYRDLYSMGIVKSPYTFQHQGISMIDGIYKDRS